MIGRNSRKGAPEYFAYTVRIQGGQRIKCFGKHDAEKIAERAKRSGASATIIRIPVVR